MSGDKAPSMPVTLTMGEIGLLRAGLVAHRQVLATIRAQRQDDAEYVSLSREQEKRALVLQERLSEAMCDEAWADA